jgi:hypothetical protein
MRNFQVLQKEQSNWVYATPAIAAIFYPFLLKVYHAALSFSVTIAVTSFLLSLVIPIHGFLVAWDLSKKSAPTSADVFLKQISWLTVASPPIFVADGVITGMLGSSVSDTDLWAVFWILTAAAGWIAHICAAPPALVTRISHSPSCSPLLRVAHGISALLIIVLFLGMHLTNHFAGIISEEQHRQLMDLFRTIYRGHIVEPVIVLLFLFQTISGIALVQKLSTRPADFFRSLQIASGAYLVFFVIAHMNSVFIYARKYAGIKTDWDFATGAPTGLLHDAWNIRLVPHYYLGVFLMLSHLILAARLIAIAHGARPERANVIALLGIVFSAAVAFVTMLGMCGVHISAL